MISGLKSGEKTKHQWVLREEIIRATHRWPVIVLFCLTGSLLGWIFAFGWPSPHRATKELYVGLNIQQASASKDRNAAQHAGIKIRNANDYKNWQMASLNSLIFTNSIIDETMARLRETDPYWSEVDRTDLVAMLHVYWRNAGKWRLVAEAGDPEHASQAVIAWQDVVIEQVYYAVQHSQNALVLDRQLNSIISVQSQAQINLTELVEFQDLLETWRVKVSTEPADQPADSSERWLLYQTLASADLGEAWAPLLETFPPPETVLRDYNEWLKRATALLEQEILVLQAQIEALESKKQHIAQQYAEASKKSLGLSPDLLVDNITDEQPELSKVRPTGWLILIGSALGLICWAIAWFARITLQVKS